MSVGKITLMRSESVNVFVNQAIEAALLESVGEDEAALYLWRNERAVVIGRNQNAYAECRVQSLEESGGLLARRLSGGGAVWHDLGNLNFTFVAREGNFDRRKNFKTVLDALASLGIRAELGGRNDLVAEGAKFGGNAYYKRGGAEFHHGTLLVSTAPEDVARYLTPPGEKFVGKSVKSVSSRVAPLAAYRDDVTVERVADALEESFAAAYPSAAASRPIPFVLGAEKVLKWTAFFGTDEWRYGKKRDYVFEFAAEVFGERAVVRVAEEDGEPSAVDVASDSLDAEKVSALKFVLSGEEIPADAALTEEEKSEVRAEAERLAARIREEKGV